MRGILGGQRPDITPAQIVGTVLSNVGPVLVLCGVDLDTEQLIALGTITASGIALIGGDAALRIGRNIKDGAVQSAALTSGKAPHDAVIDEPFTPGEVAEVTGDDEFDDDIGLESGGGAA